MDIAVARAPVAPWIAVGVLLAVAGMLLALLVVALVARRRAAPAEPAERAGPAHDDLAGFFDSPPGSSAAAGPAAGPAVALVPLAAPPSAPAPPGPPRRAPAWALLALAGLVVGLGGAAAAVAAHAAGPEPRASGNRVERATPAAEPGAEARLRFAGIVLEERAVGVTVSYPELVVVPGREGAVASLELPTWNCLAAEAPEDPVASGCARGRTQYAELRSPDLEVIRDGERLHLAGGFATSVRPTGSAPEPTGSTYEVAITAVAERAALPGRWTPASGELELGGRSTAVVAGGLRISAD